MPPSKFSDKTGLGKLPLGARLLLFFLLWLVISYGYVYISSQRQVRHIPYSVFKTKVIEGKVAEIEVTEQTIKGQFIEKVKQKEKQGAQGGKGAGRQPPPKYFETILPSFGDPNLLGLLEKHDVTIRAHAGGKSWLTALAITVLPWVLIIGFFIYINKKMRGQMGGSGGPFSFGKSRAKKITREEVQVRFEDVAGLTNAKKELTEMVEYLRDPAKFQNLGAEIPKGVLLAGPPGTGKTLMARAMAGEAGVPFYSISGSEFIEMFVGVGASRVRDLFDVAKKAAPALIFIDELDSIGRVRGTGIGGGHDEREQTLNQILSEIDGFSPRQSVIVLAATNRPDVLDPALVRPGRFDRQITLDMPQRNARKEILTVHAKKVAISKEVDFDQLAGATVGFSGAELKNLINEAALLRPENAKKKLVWRIFRRVAIRSSWE